MRKIILSFLAASLATGCGNVGPHAGTTLQPLSGAAAGTSPVQMASLTNVPSNYACPAQPNVVPTYDWTFDGTGDFTVCRDNGSLYSIFILGSVSTSPTVCVFPVQHVTATRLVYKLDVNGQPMYQCANTEQEGIEMTFNLTNFDGVFIVAAQDKNSMIACFMSPGTVNCPHYAQGKI